MAESFEQDLEVLQANLRQLVELLHSHGEGHWAEWFAADLTRVEGFDRQGLLHILRASGGMGSFNDVILHPVNGHTLDESQVDQVNARLNELRIKVFGAARSLVSDLGD